MWLISNFYKKGTCADQSRPLPLSLNPYRDVYKVARSCRGDCSYLSGDLNKAVKPFPSPQIYYDQNETYVVHKLNIARIANAVQVATFYSGDKIDKKYLSTGR